MDLDINNCRGQVYDNGSNMMGHKQGVQKRVLEVNHKALCVPCTSHTLNLVVADSAKSSVISISFFGTLQRLYNIFSSSVQRWSILQQHVKLTVKSLSTTRWECRIDSVKAVRKEMPGILEALTDLEDHAIEKKDGDTLSTAQGLSKELRTWKFLLCVMVWYDVLNQINRISKLLQSPNISIERIKSETDGVTQFLQDYRDNGLARAETAAKEIATKLKIEMTFPVERQRKKTCLFDYEGGEETQFTPEQRFRAEFFIPLVEQAASASQRFNQVQHFFDIFGFLYSAKNMKKAVEDGTLDASCKKLEKFQDVEAEELANDVQAAVRAFPSHVSKPAEMLHFIYKEELLEAYATLSIALRLLLTLPVTVASGERSFSYLRLIKNYMRSTMLEERLNGLALIAIEQRVQRTLDMEALVKEFAEAKERRSKGLYQ